MFGWKRLACSFCGKSASEVSKLVAGPRVYICDGCVTLARRILDEAPPDGASPAAPRPGPAGLWTRIVGRWHRAALPASI